MIMIFIIMAYFLGIVQLVAMISHIYYEGFEFDFLIQKLTALVALAASASFLISYHFGKDLSIPIRFIMLYLLLCFGVIINSIFYKE